MRSLEAVLGRVRVVYFAVVHLMGVSEKTVEVAADVGALAVVPFSVLGGAILVDGQQFGHGPLEVQQVMVQPFPDL